MRVAQEKMIDMAKEITLFEFIPKEKAVYKINYIEKTNTLVLKEDNTTLTDITLRPNSLHKHKFYPVELKLFHRSNAGFTRECIFVCECGFYKEVVLKNEVD